MAFSRSLYFVDENGGPSQPILILSSQILCCSVSVMIRVDEKTATGELTVLYVG